MRPSLLLFTSLFAHTVLAQGTMRNWHFGANASVDMLAQPPTFQPGSAMLAIEAAVSISDENGDLLFYSEGTRVWNADHQTMPNGTGLLGNGIDFQQGVATCPWPGEPNKHLLFHTNEDHTLYWSVIDMDLDGGSGDVINKNTFLATGIGEAMTIARNRNGQDYWLVVREFAADLFKVYPITNGGVGQLSSTVACGMDNFDFTGMARFNHAHTWMATTMRGGFGNEGRVGLFPFDAATGILSPGTLVPSVDPVGLEFSCSDRFLYHSRGSLPIQQFNMLTGNAEDILAAPVDATVPIGASALANAPDNRIYFVWNDQWNRGSRVLGAILEPEEAGLACNMTDSAIVWTDPFAATTGSLPNFIQQQASVEGNCTPVSISMLSLTQDAPTLSTTLLQNGAWVRWPSVKKGYHLDVYNSTGTLVQSARSQGPEHWMDMAHMSAGVYVLRITAATDRSVHNLKFVKE